MQDILPQLSGLRFASIFRFPQPMRYNPDVDARGTLRYIESLRIPPEAEKILYGNPGYSVKGQAVNPHETPVDDIHVAG